MPESEHRKHTPIVSRQQQKFFGAEIGRAKAGKKTRSGMSEETLTEHLEESKGKNLPETISKLCKAIDLFIDKAKQSRFAPGGYESPVEREVEEREEGISPEQEEKTNWREFIGGRSVVRPGSPTPKGTYYYGPRGGYGRPTGDPWRKIRWEMPEVKSLSDKILDFVTKGGPGSGGARKGTGRKKKFPGVIQPRVIPSKDIKGKPIMDDPMKVKFDRSTWKPFPAEGIYGKNPSPTAYKIKKYIAKQEKSDGKEGLETADKSEWWDNLTPLQQAQLKHTRPDLFVKK